MASEEAGEPAGEDRKAEVGPEERGKGEEEEAKVRELRRRLEALGREMQSQREPQVAVATTPQELPGELAAAKLTDETLRRFLVARRWSTDKAFQVTQRQQQRLPSLSLLSAVSVRSSFQTR